MLRSTRSIRLLLLSAMVLGVALDSTTHFPASPVYGQNPNSGPRNLDATLPIGFAQLTKQPTLFRGGVDESGREYFLNGQASENAKLILTASNGFFDTGVCRAEGESELPKTGDDELIKPNFAYLTKWDSCDGSIRWHVWLPNPGRVQLSVNMRVSKTSAGSKLQFSLGNQSHAVSTVASGPSEGQPWKLEFNVAKPGEHTIALTALEVANPQAGVGELHTIDVFGEAIKDAQLLRARWRPAAVHGGYSATSAPKSRMWVMTTRSVSDFSSYSPITTPFGYYGTSFDSQRRVKGGFNFSMWAAGARGSVPPLSQMPHLLAAGSPTAEFSGFGHEGSGVKLRGWIPLPDQPTLCVQALRVDSDGDYDTYYGYYWDQPRRRWGLYAVGRKWNKGKSKEHLAPGSFCEVPGPPHVQRSGDQVREVRRRGWHYGSDRQWHAMDRFVCKSKGPMNKQWFTTPEGEFAMATGGMRYYAFRQPDVPRTSSRSPAFLSDIATQQLFQLPIEITEISPISVARDSATLRIKTARLGDDAKASVYFGESDCLTFAKRELHGTERRSAVSQSTQADNRSWQRNTKPARILGDAVEIKLDGLKPNTTYFYRILVTNTNGQVWSFVTRDFHTQDAR